MLFFVFGLCHGNLKRLVEAQYGSQGVQKHTLHDSSTTWTRTTIPDTRIFRIMLFFVFGLWAVRKENSESFTDVTRVADGYRYKLTPNNSVGYRIQNFDITHQTPGIPVFFLFMLLMLLDYFFRRVTSTIEFVSTRCLRFLYRHRITTLPNAEYAYRARSIKCGICFRWTGEDVPG